MNEELISKEIEDNRDEYIEFLREILKTDSYNPPGNEKNVALKIAKYLKEAGINCEIFPFGENRANLIASLSENFEGKNLLYNGHMDVVPPGNEEEWKFPPLSATIKRKKYIYGRGATDMKGALAAMTITLKILKKLNLNLSGNLILNAVADEETGGKFGTGWCIDNIFRPRSIKCDFAIIGEPTSINRLPKAIILGEKGHLQVKIITNGVSCHSMAPFMGKNAIYMMSEIIENLDKLDDYIPRVEPPVSLEEIKNLISVAFPNREIFNRIFNEQPLLRALAGSLTQFTKSLNMINGGIKENVVPDQCEAIIDFRLLPNQTFGPVIEGMKKLINELGYKIKDEPTGKPKEVFVYMEIFMQNDGSIWSNWEESQDLKQLYNLVENVYEKRPFYSYGPGASDAHYLRNDKYCEQTIEFGPGDANSMHAVDEYIEIQDYLDSIKVYTLFAYNILK